MFNLNDSNFGGGVTIFNNGNAGKVENVKMNVVKKLATDPDNAPDYKLIFKDVAGSEINVGFYYHKDNPNFDEKRNKDLETWTVSRALSAARSVVPSDFVFPEVSNSKEALDTLFKIVKDNAENNNVNVYVTYGTSTKPSQYLQLRYFNFVENMNTPQNLSKLKPSPADLMERITPDQTISESAVTPNTLNSGW